jgi:hypothetical protein
MTNAEMSSAVNFIASELGLALNLMLLGLLPNAENIAHLYNSVPSKMVLPLKFEVEVSQLSAR